MSAMFDDLMTGLDEVEAFLSGEKAGYKVNLPADIDVNDHPAAVEHDPGPILRSVRI